MTLPRSLGTAGLALLCAPLLTPAQAAGVDHTTPASACRPYKGEDAAALAAHRIQPSFTYNADPVNSRLVICPVMRNPDSDGVTVRIQGAAPGGVTVVCTVLSYRYDGTLGLMISRSANSAPFAMLFPFSPNEAPRFGYLNAICDLPAAGRGWLFSLHTDE